jgi:hypothetical protein
MATSHNLTLNINHSACHAVDGIAFQNIDMTICPAIFYASLRHGEINFARK